MKITVVRPGDLGAVELGAWRALLHSGSNFVNPFLCPEFTLAIGRVRACARVAVVEDGGDIVGFFPFERHALGIGKPVGAGLTDAQGMILAKGLELDVICLLKACGLSVWEFDHLAADQFPTHHSSRHPSPIMDLRNGYEAYLEVISDKSAKTYKSTLYKERKLGRDVGELSHDYATTDLATLHTLLRWKGDQYRRTGRNDRFAQPWIVQLVEELLHVDTPSFGGVLDMIYADGRPVAGHFGLRSDTVLAGWFPAYDTSFARYSPGLVHHLAMAREAAKRGISVIDMGRGEKEYKDKLMNGEFQVAEGRLARPAPSAGLHWLIRTPVRAARNTVLAHPLLRHPADRALKIYGRLRTSLRQTSRADPARSARDAMG
ncbi:GNAT family N-acetyltransferase [Streptosporangium sp. NPDC002544]|uniref:GNAT family N-acetyltransferase n=1 Tax=Streptosporangium sp. NPDC002544 TaxID=3154538 RepID=UPI00332AE026